MGVVFKSLAILEQISFFVYTVQFYILLTQKAGPGVNYFYNIISRSCINEMLMRAIPKSRNFYVEFVVGPFERFRIHSPGTI